MMLMIPAGYETAPPDVQLDPALAAAMMKYNDELQKAGVLITLEGLHPPPMGARVSFATGTPVVTDEPFAEVKEVADFSPEAEDALAGYDGMLAQTRGA